MRQGKRMEYNSTLGRIRYQQNPIKIVEFSLLLIHRHLEPSAASISAAEDSPKKQKINQPATD